MLEKIRKERFSLDLNPQKVENVQVTFEIL